MALFYWNGSTSGDITDQANWGDGVSGYPGNGDDAYMSDDQYGFWNYTPSSVDTSWASMVISGFSADIGTFEGALTLNNYRTGLGGNILTASGRDGYIAYNNSGDGSGGGGDGWDLQGTYGAGCIMTCSGSGSSYLKCPTGTWSGTINLVTGGVDLVDYNSNWGGTFNIYSCNLYEGNYNIINWYSGTWQSTASPISITECNCYGDLDTRVTGNGLAGTFYPMTTDIDIYFNQPGDKNVFASKINTTQYNIFGTVM